MSAKNLVIVESPTKVKSIKKYLGSSYTVMASLGHLRDLPKSQIGVDVKNNFEPKYITIRGKGELLTKMKSEAKNAKKIFLATDPDREGEAIAWHLAQILDIDENSNCRISFNEITADAVKNAVKNPRPIDKNLVDAQQARRVLDRIVGYKISPLLWKKVRKGLSAGRVQSVATRIICDREEEINAFKSEEYWNVLATLTPGSKKDAFTARLYSENGKKLKITNENDAKCAIDSLKKEKFVVAAIKKAEKIKKPMPPFTTSTMQQEASRKLNFTSKRTMQAAQQLYEGIDIKGVGTVGLITYMRTDSLRISDEARKDVGSFILNQYGKDFLPSTLPQYKSKKSAQDAHEAIRPTNVSLVPADIKDSLSADQFKLYKLIWERFVAAHMKSAVIDTVAADIEAGAYILHAAGSKIKFKGYMAVYVEGTDATDETDETEQKYLPELKDGMALELINIDGAQHFTAPPPRYTEATLIKTMEEKGIGRPSTYAPTITTILSRGYIDREKKTLKPTELGFVVNDIMKLHFKDIADVTFTANMEEELDSVEDGNIDWIEVIRTFYTPFEITLKKAEEEIGNIEIKDEVSDVPCEKCGRMMVIKTGRFGKFLACPGFPACRNAKPIFKELEVSCPKCGGKVYVKKSKRGKTYFGCENNPKCDFMSWDEPLKEKCPNCGDVLYKKSFKGKSKVVCINDNCKYERANG